MDYAMQDYQRVARNTSPCRLVSFANNETSSLEFSRGILHGSLEGTRHETIEFVSCIRGSFSFLWAFACSPIEVSKEVSEAIYAMGDFIAHSNVSDLLSAALPELVECRQCWNSWSEYTKG